MYTMRQRILGNLRRTTAIAWLAICLTTGLGPGFALAAAGPVVQLDPTVLIQEIKESRSIADGLQADIQAELAEVERHQADLQRLGCHAEDTAWRCKAPRQALREAYARLLDNTEARLPPLQDAVDRIAAKLKTRIATSGSPLSSDAQQRLLGAQPRAANTPQLLGVSGFRLSAHLEKLQRLVGGAASGTVSIDVIAADLYLDMVESARIIDALGDAVATSKIRLALRPGEEIALLTDEAISEVQAQVFGPGIDVGQVPALPFGSASGDFVSPLAL